LFRYLSLRSSAKLDFAGDSEAEPVGEITIGKSK
jgi:hypothetical protein